MPPLESFTRDQLIVLEKELRKLAKHAGTYIATTDLEHERLQGEAAAYDNAADIVMELLAG